MVWDLVLPGCDLWVYVGAVGICLVLFLVVWFKCCGVLGVYVRVFSGLCVVALSLWLFWFVGWLDFAVLVDDLGVFGYV